MKYIKLFEAFDAELLNRILKKDVLKSEARVILLSQIKRFLEQYDIPESKVSDDLFKYLPFKSALNYITTVDDSCTNVGEDGTLCTDGKVTKAWGGTRNGYRKIKCTVCDGTGHVEKKSDISLLKFWFNKDGGYITTTAVDGIYREPTDSIKSYISSNLDDYDVVKEVPSNRLSTIKPGEFFICDLVAPVTARNRMWGYTDRTVTNTICVMWKENNRYFAINNYDSNGDHSLNYNSEGKKFGRYAWHINASKCKNIRLLKKKPIDFNNNDPYAYNTFIKTNDFSIYPISIENKIKQAHFAVILDVSKLKDKNFSKKSEIKIDRTVARSNALALTSDETVRSENIKRYIDKIYDLTKAKGEFNDLKKFGSMITRGLGGKYIIFNINGYSSSSFMTNVEILNDYLFTAFKLLKNAELNDTLVYLKDDATFNSVIEDINNRYKTIYTSSTNRRDNYDKSFTELKKLIKEYNQPVTITQSSKDKELEIVKLVEDVSSDISKYLNSIKIETLEDVEIFAQEVGIMKSMVSGNRLGINNLNGFFDNMNSSHSALRSLRNSSSKYDIIINGLNMLKTIIERKQKQLNK